MIEKTHDYASLVERCKGYKLRRRDLETALTAELNRTMGGIPAANPGSHRRLWSLARGAYSLKEQLNQTEEGIFYFDLGAVIEDMVSFLQERGFTVTPDAMHNKLVELVRLLRVPISRDGHPNQEYRMTITELPESSDNRAYFSYSQPLGAHVSAGPA